MVQGGRGGEEAFKKGGKGLGVRERDDSAGTKDPKIQS
jgi:hypothetical protein